jgi:hypothetical protein
VNAIYLTLFVSAVLAASGVLFFALNVKQKSHEHADRLSLLPLMDDANTRSTGSSEES